jgi:hypothetical protein
MLKRITNLVLTGAGAVLWYLVAPLISADPLLQRLLIPVVLMVISSALLYGWVKHDFSKPRRQMLQISMMGLGLMAYVAGAIWYYTANSAAAAPQVSDSRVPGTTPTDETNSKLSPETPMTTGKYQQNNYGGTNYQGDITGPVTININPPPDLAAEVTTYDFYGTKRKISPGRVIAEMGNLFPILDNLAASGDWQKVLGQSDADIAETRGKWIGAYTFKAIALIRIGRVTEGSSMLERVKALIETRDDRQKAQYNEVLKKYLPEK